MRVKIGAVVAALSMLGTACSDGSGDSGDDGSKSSGPVRLTFWTWAPNMDKVAALWNKDHPDIQVTVNKQDGGDPAVTKLLTAIKAGSGAPDVMQAEYQKIPTLVSADALADISGDVDGSVTDQFTDADLNSVSLGSEALYGVPQDTAPLAFFYRTDLFKKYGLEVPKTWDDYAAAAAKVRKADPSVYLGTFSANDAGWFTGLAQQAGASWWGTESDAWSVDIDSAATTKVASYWGGLVQSGVIDNKPMYTPAWNNALATGRQIGWVSAVWAPGVLAGNAPKTAGKWEMAPLPTWEGTTANGAWGGSATGVTTQSTHKKEAAEFISWLNTDPEAVKALVKEAGVYPAAKSGTEALTSPPEFFKNQPDFFDVAAEGKAAIRTFTYGPNVNVAFNTYNDQFGNAADTRSQAAFVSAVRAMQDATVKDLEASGFKVAD